jgi:hypothetical protein
MLEGEGGKPLAAQTGGNLHRVLHQTLRQAVRWQIIESNPAAAAEPTGSAQRGFPAPGRAEHALALEAQFHSFRMLLNPTTPSYPTEQSSGLVTMSLAPL